MDSNHAYAPRAGCVTAGRSLGLVVLVSALCGGGLAAGSSADGGPGAPQPLGDTASATARVAAPRFVVPGPKGKLELEPGAKSARVQDDVAPGAPVAYTFVAPADQLVTIGVSSPKGDVRLSVWEAGADHPVAGTAPESGAIRLTISFEKPTELRLVAFATGEATPFRFEVTPGPGSV